MAFNFWRVEEILIFWNVFAERADDKPAVVAEPGKIVKESFGVKTDFHLGKVFL